MHNTRSAVKNLTAGSPMRLILGFAIPLFGGMLFQQFYNMMDTLIVGRFLGVQALAGVGATSSINFMIIGFCMGVCNGFAIPISQQFGAGRYDRMRRFYANSIYLSAVFSVVMTAAVCILCRQILQWMQTPSDIMGYAYTYIFIIFLGIPVTYVYNLFSAAIRALGDSRAPVVFLVISSVLNIILDIVFITAFHLGVAGAAAATVISQGVSGALSIIHIRRKMPQLHLGAEDRAFVPSYAEKLTAMGIPMGLQYSITAIGSVILQTSVNTLGSSYVAALTAGTKVNAFFATPFDAIGSTMATYGGQNAGAGKLERIGQGLRAATVIGVLYSISAFVILFFTGRQLCGIFTGERAGDLAYHGWQYLVIVSAFYIPLHFVNAVRFLIQGVGYPGTAILSGAFEMVGRAGVALFLVPRIGYVGACFASPCAWILADIFLFCAYRLTVKRLYALKAESGRA